MYKIQDIFIKPYIGNEILTHMYYRNPIGRGDCPKTRNRNPSA